MSEDTKELSVELFKSELESKVRSVFSENQVNGIKEAAEKYYGQNNTRNGIDFWKTVILNSSKDYPTTSARYFQSLTELKSRLSRLFDETLEFQKKEIEKEKLSLDLEDLEDKLMMLKEVGATSREQRRVELDYQLVEQEFLKAKIRAAFMKDSLGTLEKEVADFKAICDEYMSTGEVKPFEVSRLEEMESKKNILFLAHVLGNKKELSPSELALLMQADGTIRPPDNCETELKRLGMHDLANQITHNRTLIDNANQMRLENKVPDMPKLESPIKIIKE